MARYLENMMKKRNAIITCCTKGDYVLASPATEGVLEGDFLFFLASQSSCEDENKDKELLDAQKKMESEARELKHRYPGLLVREIPIHVAKFKEAPKNPTLLFGDPEFSGVSSFLQILFVVHPIRKLYLHNRWKDGVPRPTRKTELLSKQVAHIHDCISYLFDRMLRYCSRYTSVITPDSFIQECYETVLFRAQDAISFNNTSPNAFLEFFFESFDYVLIGHPAFKRIIMDTFKTRYINRQGYYKECLYVELDVGFSVQNMFTMDQILFPQASGVKMGGIKQYDHFSEYLLFVLRYNLHRQSNICILHEVLEIPGTSEVFDLTGAIYSYFNSNQEITFRVLVKYGQQWYIVDDDRVIRTDFKRCKEAIFLYDTLHTVLYRKRLNLKIK